MLNAGMKRPVALFTEIVTLHKSQCFAFNLPDLNTVDYYVSGAVVKDVKRSASTTKAQLIDRIKAVF